MYVWSFFNKQSGATNNNNNKKAVKGVKGVKGKTIEPEKELGLNERQFNFYFHSTPKKRNNSNNNNYTEKTLYVFLFCMM